MKQLSQAQIEQVAGGDFVFPTPYPFPIPNPDGPIYPWPVFHQLV